MGKAVWLCVVNVWGTVEDLDSVLPQTLKHRYPHSNDHL